MFVFVFQVLKTRVIAGHSPLKRLLIVVKSRAHLSSIAVKGRARPTCSSIAVRRHTRPSGIVVRRHTRPSSIVVLYCSISIPVKMFVPLYFHN